MFYDLTLRLYVYVLHIDIAKWYCTVFYFTVLLVLPSILQTYNSKYTQVLQVLQVLAG